VKAEGKSHPSGKKKLTLGIGLQPGPQNTKTRMTDAETIDLIKKGDPRGLNTAYEAFRSEFVHWLMKSQKCDKEDAREYYQAAILIVYDNIHAGKLDNLRSSLKTYLFGIGKNLVWQQYRDTQRQQAIGAEFYLQNHLQADDDEGKAMEMNLEIISHSFDQLGEPCHELLEQFYFHRKSMDEICVTMGYKNPESAKNQKYKCMERLRKMAFGSTKTTPTFQEPVMRIQNK
jgi:RNA polymerase sigma factor (sigma-70 family)